MCIIKCAIPHVNKLQIISFNENKAITIDHKVGLIAILNREEARRFEPLKRLKHRDKVQKTLANVRNYIHGKSKAGTII
jgi:hypothetical protein